MLKLPTLTRLRLTLSRRQGALMIAVATLAGLVIGLLLVPRVPTLDEPDAPLPGLTLLDEPIGKNADSYDHVLERVRRHVAGYFSLQLEGEQTEKLTYASLGVGIDTVRLKQLVRDALDVTSPLRRTLRRQDASGLGLPVPLTLSTPQALDVLLELKDKIDRPARDARLDLNSKQWRNEQVGRVFDVDATLKNITTALSKGESTATASIERIKPKRRVGDLSEMKFDKVMGQFETSYDRSERSAARTFNLALAAAQLDGYVLLPGEVFDFNAVVGPRDEANGYKVAPIIAQGELVDGIGGGTCQISGTLHGAAFFAGLEIVERYPHTRPSSYIKMGLDATVVYPTINFRVKNPYAFPVVLHQVVEDGQVRAQILGPQAAPTVTLVRKIDDVIPYEELERPDTRLPRGKRVLAQRGVPGFKLHRYRIVREGPHARRERFDDVYPPTTQIIHVGTAADDAKAKTMRDDPHPEYTADELLVMTHQSEAEGGKFFEDREPGRTGERGWTETAGMPVWKRQSTD